MTTNNLPADQTVSVGDWILTMILSSLPIVGFIMILVWAFGDGAKPSKRNYARATIIMAVIVFVIGIITFVLFAILGIFAAEMGSMSDVFSSYSY